MKKSLLASLIALSAFSGASAWEADLDGTTFTIDTTYSYVVGPGVEQTKYSLSNGAGRAFNVLTSTLTRSKGATKGFVEPRVIIGQDQCSGGEQVPSMAERHNHGDYRYLTGVNGDFFITAANSVNFYGGKFVAGYPHMTCVIDGKMAAPNYFDVGNHLATLVTASDNWYIDGTDVVYTIYSEDLQSSIHPTQFNYPHRDGEFMIYNSYMGKTTAQTNGKELLLRLDPEYDWCINQKLKFKVEGEWTTDVNIAIPEDCLVFSCGPDYDSTALDQVIGNGVVYVEFGITLPNHDGGITPDIQHIVGGDVRILNQGEITREALRWINTPSTAYQRALVGFSKDRDMMVFAAVDAPGLNYYECAALMRELGCYDALHLDGGGSTAIWSDKFGVFNDPRESGINLRSVANGLFFAMKAPKDDVVTSIRFADHKMILPEYGTFSPVLFGYNQYGQLIDTDVKGFTLVAPADLGQILNEGTTLLAGATPGSYVLEAQKDGMTSSVIVTIADSNPAQLRYNTLLIDNFHPVKIQLFATVGYEEMNVDPIAYEWTSDNEGVATVSADGTITGLADGTATITGVLGDQVHTIAITVECPTAREYNLIGNDASLWKGSGTGVKVNNLTIDENGAMNVDFSVTNARAPKVTLRRDMVLWSRPDAIEVVINPGDMPITLSTASIIPNGAKSLNATRETLEANTDNVLTFDISEFTDAEDPGIYPLTLRSVAFNIELAKGDYNLTVKSINAIYNSFEAGVNDIRVDKPVYDDGYYNMQGIRIAAPDAPGIYIHKGKKILVK